MGRRHGRRSLPAIDTPFPLSSRRENNASVTCPHLPFPLFPTRLCFLWRKQPTQPLSTNYFQVATGQGNPTHASHSENPHTHPPSHFLPTSFHERKRSTIPARHLTHPPPPFQTGKCGKCKGCVTCPHLRVCPDSHKHVLWRKQKAHPFSTDDFQLAEGEGHPNRSFIAVWGPRRPPTRSPSPHPFPQREAMTRSATIPAFQLPPDKAK